jgi:hypothetical protein
MRRAYAPDFFRFGRDPIVERSLEFGALRIAQFAVNPAVQFSSNVFINIPQQILQLFARIEQARHDGADRTA